VRTCVIFNPAANGDKARRFRALLNRVRAQAALRETRATGDARTLAAQAVEDGFDTLVAAGGDGTVHEVLNGLGDAPEGFARARLGVLPLGTVNVLARELHLPLAPETAWQVLLQGREARLDLPWAEWTSTAGRERRYFAQLAGAGLDARAIQCVSWGLKKKIGPLAYILAGLKSLSQPAPRITVSDGSASLDGELVLLGNGRLFGGPFAVFPQASMGDGLLDACVFPRAGWATLLRCSPSLLIRKRLPAGVSRSLRASSFTFTSVGRVPFELDGELVGELPATFGVLPGGLRVIVPPAWEPA
jgi:YegS/Rv2252/BmrU family lipid kinase